MGEYGPSPRKPPKVQHLRKTNETPRPPASNGKKSSTRVIKLKRIYEPAGPNDGFRILVDRVWPRGLTRGAARIDLWLKEVAPSTPLRKWFGHDPALWDEFRQRYFAELDENADPVDEILNRARKKSVTLLFGAKDEKHNNAVALKEYLNRAQSASDGSS